MFALLIQHPVLWLFLAGIFAGAVAALVTTPAAGRKNPAKFRAARQVKIYLLLTALVLCVTAAFFAAARDYGFTRRFLYAAAAGFISGALGLRFKKAAGLPLLVLYAAACVISLGGLSGWNAARKNVPAGRVVVLSLQPQTALSVTAAGRAETIVSFPAGETTDVRAATEFLVFPAAYPVLGSLGLYRPSAVLSGAARRETLSAGEPSFCEKILLSLPGVSIQSVETPLPPLELFAAYNFFVNTSGVPYFSEE